MNRLTHLLLAACLFIMGPAGATELSDAKTYVYKTVGKAALRLHVFAPTNHPTAEARPAIVFFFGGGWDHGEPSQFVQPAGYFASRGLVAICPEYRTHQSHGTTPLECVADGKSAMRWVRAHAAELGIDPNRIAASGGSAGGHVAAATAVLKDVEEAGADTGVGCVPNALVLFNPVLDTTDTGYGAKKLGARAREASPVHHISAGLPPTVIFHGRADTTAPFENSQRFADEMKRAGNVCTLLGYDGQRHGFYFREPFYATVLSEADKFLVQLGWIAPAPEAPGNLAAPKAAAIVLDDDEAEWVGEWKQSRRQTPLVGQGYRYDDAPNQGKKSARFVPNLPRAGKYEVRVLYPVTSKSASNTKVSVVCADGEQTLTLNQLEKPHALGVFRFEAGKAGVITISNEGADGFVVVDGVELVPAELKTKAATKTSGKVALKQAAAEPVRLARDAQPQSVDGKFYDLVVVGSTPGGIACAVRAAREGLSVLLVQHTRHLGGILANGLFQWDALYGGPRAPLFNEYAHLIEEHYRKTYGEKSSQYSQARFTQEHYPMSRFEPSVAEREFNRLVAAESNLTLLLGYYPAAVEREGARLTGATLQEFVAPNAAPVRVRAAMFADATYEGDLAALAKVPYRVGREGRDEYGEPHAGKVFCNIAPGPGPRDAVKGRLNLHPYAHKQGAVDPASPFTADGAIQAYNYRFCLSSDPNNRRLPEQPPNYNREEYLHFNRKGMSSGRLNGKGSFNSAILPGENYAYPDADWPTREKIIERHLHFALGLMYFLQNDESVSPAQRAQYREIGLPLDEFADNHNVPYEMYVREARRLVGRYVFKEQDNSLAPGLGRTPIHADSIAITDWAMDSHDCSTNRHAGYDFDGKLILTEESRPAQIPWRCLLPAGVDNLLVPVCLSATHVAWGAVRLEPVWMETGEAAGIAAALAKQRQMPPARLDADLLLRTLAERRLMVSFFNDVNVAGPEAWIPAVQYFGARGFFRDYDAKPGTPLTKTVAKVWAEGLAQLRAGKLEPMALARSLPPMPESPNEPVVSREEFATLAKLPLAQPASAPLPRGEACRLMFEALGK